MTAPFRILLAASASFINDEVLKKNCDFYLSNRPGAEIHCITQKIFTKMVTSYSKNVIVHKRDFTSFAGGANTMAYCEVIENMDAVLVFWDEQSRPEQNLILKCQKLNKRVKVILFESVKQEIDRLKKEGKIVKRKKITVALTDESRQRYKDAHKKWYTRQYPNAVNDGFYSGPKILAIDSGSRMDTFIVNFLIWEGWSATKVNNIARQINGKLIPSSTKKGTFDVHCTIAGRSIKIETKHNTDKPSEEQVKMQERERRAGAVAEFVYSIEDFFILYDKILNHETIT